MVMFQLISMSSYAKNKLQMENFHKFTQYTHYLSVT